MTEIVGTGMVLMPVPLPFVHEVAAHIAELKAGKRPTGVEPRAETSVAVPGQPGEWTEQMVHTLADELSYPGVVALMDRCANSAGEWVNKADVEEAEAISPIQLRNELGALSKLTRRLFDRVTWPMQWRKDRGKYHYRMDPVVADWWHQARGAQR